MTFCLSFCALDEVARRGVEEQEVRRKAMNFYGCSRKNVYFFATNKQDTFFYFHLTSLLSFSLIPSLLNFQHIMFAVRAVRPASVARIVRSSSSIQVSQFSACATRFGEYFWTRLVHFFFFFFFLVCSAHCHEWRRACME